MIEIYQKGNENYEQNGDMTLFPESCELDMELNGTWAIELYHPIDEEGRWKYLREEAVIAVPTPYSEKQFYQIYKTKKEEDGVTAFCYPVFYNSKDDCFLLDVRPTNKTGQQALDLMTAPNSRYQAQSDISKAATAYYVRKNLMEAIQGDDENSFLIRWGGEVYYDNFTIIIKERVGADRGASVEFGKNLEAIQEEVDMSEVATRIVPVAYNGYMLEGNQPWVDSPRIRDYSKVYTRTITFDDIRLEEDGTEENPGYPSLAELREALKKRCQEEFAAGLDLPSVSYDVSLIDLADLEEYQDVKELETISLGDTVRCRNRQLGIETEARAIRLVWDCIRKKNISVELGDYRKTAFDSSFDAEHQVDQVIRPDGTVMAEKIKGFIDGAVSQLRLQSTVAKKQKERAILFEDLDPDSELYGAMAMGTQGLQIAWQRTTDGKEWDWATALTGKGLMAGIIVAGILSDKLGNNIWNLDTGELITKYMKATNADISGKLTSSDGNIAGFQMGKDGFQANIFGKAHYTEADLMRAQQISLGIVEADAKTIAYYDLNKDGRVSSVDLLLMQRIINGQDPAPDIQGQVRINPASVDAAVTVEGTSSNAKGFGVRIGIGQVDGSTAEYEFLSVKSLTVGNTMDGSGQSNVEITGQDVKIRGKSVYSLFQS